MRKLWQIVKYEYTRHVFQKRFLISLLSLPAVVIVMVGVGLLIGFLSIDTSPVGYIDRSGILDNPVRSESEAGFLEPEIDFNAYQDENQAELDLEAGEIQGYYVIPETYPESLEVQLVFLEMPDSGVLNDFNDFMLENLNAFQNLDPQIRERLQEGSTITITSLDGSREIRDDQWFMIFTPFIAGIMFVIVVMTSGGYLLQAVVEEKENRTMEIVITSVTPTQLMTGKIVGDIGVGLTQLVIWLIFGWVAVTVGAQFFPFLQDFSLPTDYILVLFLILLPSFVMVAAIMAAIGSTMTELREAQQVQGLFTLPMMIPYYLSSTIMMNPNGTLAMVMSFFPLTAPITILMRMAFTVVPVWQIVLNVSILVVFAAFAIWFAGRAFRMGMLRYGKKLSIKDIFGKRVVS